MPDLLKDTSGWAAQNNFDGAITESISERLYAYALGFINPFERARPFTALGDALIHVYQDGKRLASNFFADVKGENFGRSTPLMKLYLATPLDEVTDELMK